MNKIGVLGSGQVAKVLAEGFIKHGFDVMVGTRNTDKLEDWKQTSGAKTGTFEEAAKFGRIIVLAVKGDAGEAVLEMAGPQNMQKKTVIDVTNPIANAAPENGVLKFFTNLEESHMEQLQLRFPELHFVKAFSCVGSAHMVNPQFDEQPSMFICGNNDNAKEEVKDILVKFGWGIEDMGKATAARAIEPLCMLWCILGFNSGQWNHAFKLLRK